MCVLSVSEIFSSERSLHLRSLHLRSQHFTFTAFMAVMKLFLTLPVVQFSTDFRLGRKKGRDFSFLFRSAAAPLVVFSISRVIC